MRMAIRFPAAGEAVGAAGEGEAEGKKLLSLNRTALLLLLLPRGEVDDEGARLPRRALMPDREMRRQTRLD